MRLTPRRLAVGAIWLLATAGAVSIAFLGAEVQSDTGTSGFDTVFLSLALAAFVYATTGAVLTLRRPGNVIGGFMLATGAIIGLTFNGYGWGGRLTLERGPQDPAAGFASLAGVMGMGLTFLAIPLLALLFPDGRFVTGWVRRGAWAIAVALAGILLGAAVHPGAIGGSLGNNPIGIDAPIARTLGDIANAAFGLVVLGALGLAVAGVTVRFRRARGIERQQMKWFVGANLLVAVFVGASIADGATSPTLFDQLAPISMSLPAIAVAVAILRYRLYDIDRLISRTVSWAIVSGVLVGVFALGVVVLQGLLSGVTQGDTLAVAASTLAAFALFQPVRRRVQRVVDRRFDRARVDASQAVADFTDHVRDSIALDAVSVALEGATGMLRPAHVRLWLRADSNEATS